MSTLTLTNAAAQSGNVTSAINGIQDWIGGSNCGSIGYVQSYPLQTYTYPQPVSMRPVLNGFIVTVGYFYCTTGKWPVQGEYVFTDVKEATKFIQNCLEIMLPK